MDVSLLLPQFGDVLVMVSGTRPATLRDLRNSGWASRSVKQEIRANFLRMLQGNEELFPGIIGYENTVIPEINLGLIAGHDLLFLGEKGQAKSRLMRSLVRFLDDEVPYLDDARLSGPRGPLSADHLGRQAFARRASRGAGADRLVAAASSAMPNGWRRAPSSPTSSARSTRPSWPPAPACRPRRPCTSA